MKRAPKSGVCRSFPYKLVNDREYEVTCPDTGEIFRVCLQNVSSAEPTIAIACPGLYGNFNLNYKWQFHVPAIGSGCKGALEGLNSVHGGISLYTKRSKKDLAEVIYTMSFYLVQLNKKYIPDSAFIEPQNRTLLRRARELSAAVRVDPFLTEDQRNEFIKQAQKIAARVEKDSYSPAMIDATYVLNELSTCLGVDLIEDGER